LPSIATTTPPGHQVAHRSHVIDMTDGAALRALIEQEKPHLIVPEIEAIATDTLLEIEAEQLAEVIPTARAARSDHEPRGNPPPGRRGTRPRHPRRTALPIPWPNCSPRSLATSATRASSNR
jgi:hypothetical protein